MGENYQGLYMAYLFLPFPKLFEETNLQIFGSNVIGSVNKKHGRQIIEYHGSALFLKLKKKIAEVTAVVCFYKEKQMTFVAELFSLKWSIVCPDLRDYIGLCFLCSCRAWVFLHVKCLKVRYVF